jgi:hypothetical protein
MQFYKRNDWTPLRRGPFIPALVYAIFLFIPIRPWLRWDFKEIFPLPYFLRDDSIFYLRQIKVMAESGKSFGNPYWLEHSKDGMGISDSWITWFIARFMNILSMNIFQTYFVTLAIVGFLTYIVIYSLCRSFEFSIIQSHCVTFFITYLQLPLDLLRPSPSQLLLPVVIFGVTLNQLQYKRPNHSFRQMLIVVILIFLFLTNPIYAVFLAVHGTILAASRKETFLRFVKVMSLPFIFGALVTYFTKMSTDISALETQRRLGFIHTHLPGALRTSLVSIMFIAILIFVVLRKQERQALLLIQVLITLLIAVNSQVITGRWWEMESHYSMITRILFTVSFAHFIFRLKFKVLKMFLASILVIYFSFSSIANIKNGIDVTKANQSINKKQSEIIQSLASEKFASKVILVRQNGSIAPINPVYVLFTKSYMYWDSYGPNFNVTDHEVLSRFACTTNQTLTYDEFLKRSGEMYIHRFSNPDSFFPKWDKLFELLGSKKYSSEKNRILGETFEAIYEVRARDCGLNKSRYRIDYVLDENLQLSSIENLINLADEKLG